MSKLVYEFEKNSQQRVHASLTEYNGIDLLDIRVCYEAKDGTWKPTAKGISLRVEMLPQIKKAVEALEKALGEA